MMIADRQRLLSSKGYYAWIDAVCGRTDLHPVDVEGGDVVLCTLWWMVECVRVVVSLSLDLRLYVCARTQTYQTPSNKPSYVHECMDTSVPCSRHCARSRPCSRTASRRWGSARWPWSYLYVWRDTGVHVKWKRVTGTQQLLWKRTSACVTLLTVSCTSSKDDGG